MALGDLLGSSLNFDLRFSPSGLIVISSPLMAMRNFFTSSAGAFCPWASRLTACHSPCNSLASLSAASPAPATAVPRTQNTKREMVRGIMELFLSRQTFELPPKADAHTNPTGSYEGRSHLVWEGVLETS